MWSNGDGLGSRSFICCGLRRLLRVCGCDFASHLGFSKAGGLALGGGMGFGNLSLFVAGGSLGNRSNFSTASSFEAFGGGGAGGRFGFTQSAAHGGVSVIGLMNASGFGCVVRGGFGGDGSGFGFGLCKESLLPDLLGGAMAKLRAVLAA